uniref:Uncharacterized protein n=1 Tax=Meloidogyne enterolobii TaxID=390850 RepID=A0A6V7TJX3_MELEN|nr:unnamed protein product [Meloidogyne enterolobii]
MLNSVKLKENFHSQLSCRGFFTFHQKEHQSMLLEYIWNFVILSRLINSIFK